MPVVIERDMAITWDEFQRMLPAAVGDNPYRLLDRIIEIDLSPQDSVHIALGEAGVRRIASISLPSTPVSFSYRGEQPALFSAFLERFDRYFQRGGG